MNYSAAEIAVFIWHRPRAAPQRRRRRIFSTCTVPTINGVHLPNPNAGPRANSKSSGGHCCRREMGTDVLFCRRGRKRGDGMRDLCGHGFGKNYGDRMQPIRDVPKSFAKELCTLRSVWSSAFPDKRTAKAHLSLQIFREAQCQVGIRYRM